jgi:aspartyl-tRNA synthetase
MRQLWTLGIRDKQLLVIIRKILEAPIQMPDGSIVYPQKGTLPNITPMYVKNIRSYGNEHSYLRKKTKMKPMYIVRYADDFKIFTNNRSNAEKIFKATTMWLEERLKLPISIEKSRVTNLKKEASELLGFELRARKKGNKRVAETHIAAKVRKNIKTKLKEQVKIIQKAGHSLDTLREINKYNSMVEWLCIKSI